jgi:hypothetical protein
VITIGGELLLGFAVMGVRNDWCALGKIVRGADFVTHLDGIGAGDVS